MKIEPGGYIMPHEDGEGRIFGPLNIAINNPQGCGFYFKDHGEVPFKQGRGMFLDHWKYSQFITIVINLGIIL